MALDVGTRLLAAADAAVALVKDGWEPSGNDEVVVLLGQDISLNPDDADVIQGRKVYVLPQAVEPPGMFDRSDLLTRYTLGVIVVERYTDAGVPLDEWVRERMVWVGQQVFEPLRNPTLVLADTMRPNYEDEPAGSVDEVFDLVLLTSRKAFWSSMTFRYVEQSDF